VRETSDTDGIDEPAYEPHELAAKLREVLDGRAPIIPHSVAFYSRDHFWCNTITPRRSRPTTWNEFLPISIPQQSPSDWLRPHFDGASSAPWPLPAKARVIGYRLTVLCFLSVA